MWDSGSTSSAGDVSTEVRQEDMSEASMVSVLCLRALNCGDDAGWPHHALSQPTNPVGGYMTSAWGPRNER